MKYVVLLHGLYMNHWVMLPLARYLQTAGFTCQTFTYHSVWQTLPQHIAALVQQVNTHNQQHTAPLHFVGHSLGGLVLRHFAARYPELVSGNMVTLGTPHQGSAAAKQLWQWGLSPLLLGGAYPTALDGQLPALPPHIALGSIAGNHCLGVGKLLGLTGESDGTVSVAETYCPHMRDHIVLPYSHTALLFSAEVAQQTAHFLLHETFVHQA